VIPIQYRQWDAFIRQGIDISRDFDGKLGCQKDFFKTEIQANHSMALLSVDESAGQIQDQKCKIVSGDGNM
jgi:hypothetical protein